MKAAKPASAAHGGRNWRVTARPHDARRERPGAGRPTDPWQLPSGENLVEFALNAGVVAHGLMGPGDGLVGAARPHGEERAAAPAGAGERTR